MVRVAVYLDAVHGFCKLSVNTCNVVAGFGLGDDPAAGQALPIAYDVRTITPG